MRRDARALQALRKLMGSLLAGLVFVLVKNDVDRPVGWLAKLGQLSGCQMGANRAGCIAEAGLPQRGQVEQPFDQDHDGVLAD